MDEITQLSDLQLAVMRVLWRRGEATIAQIHGDLHPQRGLALTTIATVVTRLEKRGLLKRRDRNRPLVYLARVTQPEVTRSLLAEFTERLFQGDASALVSQLLASREISPGDLERVTEMVEKARRREGTRKRGQ